MSGTRTWVNPNRNGRPLPVVVKKKDEKVTRKQVVRIARGIGKYQSEIKQVQIFKASGVLNNAVPQIAFNCNGIGTGGAGSGDSDRIGNKLRLVRIEIRVWLYSTTVATNNLLLRMGLYKTEDEAWGTPGSVLLNNVTLTSTPLVDTYRKRMYDKVHLFGLSNQSAPTDHLKMITFARKLNNVLHYSDSTAAGYSQGTFPVLWMKLFGDNVSPPPVGEILQFDAEGSMYFKEV